MQTELKNSVNKTQNCKQNKIKQKVRDGASNFFKDYISDTLI